VLRLAVPAGLVCGLAAFLAYGLARLDTGSDQTADRSTATLTLFLAATWVLALAARPYTWWRTALVLSMVAGFALAATVPFAAHFFALDFGDVAGDTIALASATGAAGAITAVQRWQRRSPPANRALRR
jgi:cation-transporting ATPase E